MTAPKPRRRTIRFAIVAVVCLLLGAVTTVGVAWGIRSWLAPPVPVVLHQITAWPDVVPAGWPEVETSYTESWFGRREIHAGTMTGHHSPLGDMHYVYVSQTGWPCLAMYSVRWPPLFSAPLWPEREGWNFQSIEGGLVREDGKARLPLAPLFPGFALDTALYAGAWYLLIFTPLPLIRAGRRRFRVSRGMCGSCGYDLKGSTGGPCPECGAKELRHAP